MTLQELNAVRAIKIRIKLLEAERSRLLESAGNIVPAHDGMPHSKNYTSKVEETALRLVETERLLRSLREKIMQVAVEVAERITLETEGMIREVLLKRYAECLSFNETARRLNLTRRQVLRLHEKFLKGLDRRCQV